MGRVESVNLGRSRPVGRATSGIDKHPTDGPVEVRAPGGPHGAGGGLAGDRIHDGDDHGGDDQAVYAYAREDLAGWEAELGRTLRDGTFGENLTTSGVDVTGAVIGERWRIGGRLVLEVSAPRIPCATFQIWMGEPGWVKRFTAAGRPGAYLRVIEPGPVEAGDDLEVIERPEHGITVGMTFRAVTSEPDLVPSVLVADALPEHYRAAMG